MTIIVDPANHPLNSQMGEVAYGNKPTDGGWLIVDPEDAGEAREPSYCGQIPQAICRCARVVARRRTVLPVARGLHGFGEKGESVYSWKGREAKELLT